MTNTIGQYERWPSEEPTLSFGTSIIFWNTEDFLMSDNGSKIGITVLPRLALKEGYSDVLNSSLLRSMDGGGANQLRNRSLANSYQVVESYILTKGQLNTLQDFYKLLGGVEPFLKYDKISDSVCLYRFRSPISYTVDSGKFKVELQLERLPSNSYLQ